LNHNSTATETASCQQSLNCLWRFNCILCQSQSAGDSTTSLERGTDQSVMLWIGLAWLGSLTTKQITKL